MAITQEPPPSAQTKPHTTAQCGLVMPISAIDGCTAEHWAEVKTIITEALQQISEPVLDVRLVSEADDVGVIQKRIVQNLYSSDIVVCDVSGKNPNVMFELGMRLAFDKATVIVKDDKTDYSFDTSVIEHVGYPRDLRFARVNLFKAQLVDKVTGTLKAAKNKEHSTFLKNFGTFKVAKLTEAEVEVDKFVLDTLAEIQRDLAFLKRTQDSSRDFRPRLAERMLMDRIQQLADRYLKENNADAAALPFDPAFRDYCEVAIDAPRNFEGPGEFHRFIERALRMQHPVKKSSN